MEYYLSKGDLLESQGKSRADVRWVDRQIAKGMVSHNEDGFYFVMEYLKERVKELEESDLRRVSKSMGEKVLDHGEIKRLEMENKELREHLIYIWGRNEHKNVCIDGLVQSFFKKNSGKYDFDDAKKKFYGLIGYEDDPLEKDERRWAEDNGILPF